MATVVGTWRSAPRPPGATMLVGPDGTAVGSVSGGCVEAAVYELCREAAADGQPRLQRYGVSDDDAFAVGLTCGGIIDLFVERVDPVAFPQLDRVAASLAGREPVAVVTVVDGPPDRVGARLVLWPDRREGSLGSARLDDAATDDVRGLLAAGRTGLVEYGPDGPRRGVALRLPVAYVGAMGSRRTHDDRMARLREAGLTDKELERLASPIGLDLGARTPEETAVSIAAEVIASRWGGGGARLSDVDGRIHHG